MQVDEMTGEILKTSEETSESMMSREIGELAAALAKAQAMIKPANADEMNYFGSSYATLSSVWEACRLALAENGLSVSQVTNEDEYGTFLVTLLLHSSGQWIKSRFRLRPEKENPQAYGSAMSYARRYTLAAIVGVSVADDDAEGAMNRDGKKKPAKKQHPRPARQPNGQPAKGKRRPSLNVAPGVNWGSRMKDLLDEVPYYGNSVGHLNNAAVIVLQEHGQEPVITDDNIENVVTWLIEYAQAKADAAEEVG